MEKITKHFSTLGAGLSIFFIILFFTFYIHSPKNKFEKGEIKCFIGKEVKISNWRYDKDKKFYIYEVSYWNGVEICHAELYELELEDCN